MAAITFLVYRYIVLDRNLSLKLYQFTKERVSNPTVKKNYLNTSSNRSEYSYDEPNSNEIDVVIKWFNASDPQWFRTFKKYATRLNLINRTSSNELSSRYTTSIEIHLNLITLSVFAPWIRHVYIVSNQKFDIHSFLPLEFAQKILFVKDDSIIPPQFIPLFHSEAIESHIYKVPGLSELYVYMNDDMMYSRPVRIEQFLDTRTNILHVPSYYKNDTCEEYNLNISREYSQVYYNTAKLFALKFGVCYPFTAHGHFPYYQLKSANKEVSTIYEHNLNILSEQKFRTTYLSPTNNVSYRSLENNGSFNSLYLSNYLSAYRNKLKFVRQYPKHALIVNCSRIAQAFRNDSLYHSVTLQELPRCNNIPEICENIISSIYLYYVPGDSKDRQMNLDKALSMCASCKPFDCIYKPNFDL